MVIGYLIIEARPLPIAAAIISILLLGLILLVDVIVIVYVINVSILLGGVIRIPVLVPPV